MHYMETTLWNSAMALGEAACRSAGGLPDEQRHGVRLQITRAAISVPSRIAEGWTRDSARERDRFLALAQGALSELQTQLLLCERLGWLPLQALSGPFDLVDDVHRMLASQRRHDHGG